MAVDEVEELVMGGVRSEVEPTRGASYISFQTWDIVSSHQILRFTPNKTRDMQRKDIYLHRNDHKHRCNLATCARGTVVVQSSALEICGTPDFLRRTLAKEYCIACSTS
jgi:hypothetical protein